jgi:hypothetical protein
MQTRSRDPLEQDADYFAACYLAPARLVVEAYQNRFGLGPPLPLTQAVAFHLTEQPSHALIRAGPGSLEFVVAVARARSFNGRHFDSLANEFELLGGALPQQDT